MFIVFAKRIMRLLALLPALLAAAAQAQYPSRPVTLIVPIAAGGAPDIAGRVMAARLAESLGQPVVVDNRMGANGNIAMEMVAKSAPDGHTLGLMADSQITINPHLYKTMPLDTLRDLTPVIPVAVNQFVLTVNPKLPVTTFPQFIEYARKANPPLAYASGGNGSQHHLTMEMLKQRAGIDLLHVPFKGGTPAATAAVAGDVAAVWSGSSNAAQIKAGRLRAIAVSGSKRSPIYPDLPTLSEFYPGFVTEIWLGLFGPANLPAPVLAKLREEVRKVLESPDTKAKLNAAGGLEPFVASPEAFEAMIRRDYEKYARVVKDLNLKLD
jgi:tripartite-type tricarboxylate transporter receptor subunit TctC